MTTMTNGFSRFADHVARASGKPLTFAVSVSLILVWAASGPAFGFSENWQLVVNTGTTIITFLMVFLIQNTQNRDGAAIQTKLDELIRASAAQNVYIGIEHLTEEELAVLRSRCEQRGRAEIAADRAEVSAQVKAEAAANLAA